MSDKYNVAVLGATGIVGKKIIELLFGTGSHFPIDTLQAVASNNSKGIKINLPGIAQEINIKTFEELDLSNVHIVFSALKNDTTKQFMPQLLQSSAIIIDKSSLYRMDPLIPLIVSGVNDRALLSKKHKLIASPNCCVIPLVHVLKALSKISAIRRIVLSTYQSASGAGFAQMQDLQNSSQSKLAFNVIPKIGNIENSGNTDEEEKIIQETNKVLQAEIAISVTTARVPVLIGHCIAANIEFTKKISLEEVSIALKHGRCIIEEEVITPKEVEGSDNVYVSRLRKDTSLEGNGINLWITSDNLRRGAATNAVEIASQLAQNNLI